MHEVMKLFKRKEYGIYYIQVSRTKKISLGTKDRREAEKLFREFKKQYYQNKFFFLKDKKNIFLSNAIKDFIEYQHKINEYSTAKRYETTLKVFLSIIEDKFLREVTKKDLELFFSQRYKIVSKNTVALDYRNLRAFFNYCIENNYLDKSPLKNIKIKTEKKLPAILSKDEIEQLFKLIDNETYKVLFACYIYTGRRRNEILNLKISDIDKTNHKLRYYNQKRKIHNVIPIIEPLRKFLYPYLEKNKFKINANQKKRIFPLRGDTVSHQFKKYFKMIGREDITVHSLRHTFASHLIMSGASLKDIQELLDHSQITTTLIYTHLTEEYREHIIRKLPY